MRLHLIVTLLPPRRLACRLVCSRSSFGTYTDPSGRYTHCAKAPCMITVRSTHHNGHYRIREIQHEARASKAFRLQVGLRRMKCIYSKQLALAFYS